MTLASIVVYYSRATEARAVITRNGEQCPMRITDNGCGGLAAQGTAMAIDLPYASGLLERSA
jgi:signal transduction histidine kinase